ncbi:hypothetical protein PO124_12100 [Bacillus licheniformis]|nr:hypothetical protein [Bacillus licheniformis]
MNKTRDIDAVIAANDGTAGGVIEALQEAGLAGKFRCPDRTRKFKASDEL